MFAMERATLFPIIFWYVMEMKVFVKTEKKNMSVDTENELCMGDIGPA